MFKLEAPDLYEIAVSNGEEWTQRGKDPSEAVARLVSRSAKSLYIITRSLSNFFGGINIEDLLRNNLAQGVCVEILSGTLETFTNPSIELQLYSAYPRAFRLEFALADGVNSIHAEPFPYSERYPATVTLWDDPKWVNKWEQRFQEVKEKLTPTL